MSAVRLQTVRIDTTGQILELHGADGSCARFHALWLRDNCQGSCCRHARNGQRLHTLLDVPAETQLLRAETNPDLTSLTLHFGPDEHRSVFHVAWLFQQYCEPPSAQRSGGVPGSVQLWDSTLQPMGACFSDLQQDQTALIAWLEAIVRDGIAQLSDCPQVSGTVAEVVDLFGYVRETNYGRWFEVRSEINPVNLAYTGLGLQVHTDNPYRDPVPGLQLLHCLASDASGGDSIVVDGFRAAQQLRDEQLDFFTLLSRYPVRYEYRGGADWLQAETALIELSVCGELKAVHFNNRSITPLRLPFDVMSDYYAAYRRFAEILQQPTLNLRFKLQPGDLFIVDNRRVLHGRTAFSGTGSRHLQGCYADHDSLQSTLYRLRQQRL